MCFEGGDEQATTATTAACIPPPVKGGTSWGHGLRHLSKGALRECCRHCPRHPFGCRIIIQGTLSCPIERYQHKLLRKSCFIVATNELDQAALPDERLKVERGFRFLKDPVFLSSTLFLKTPRRIMALCLLVYAAVQWRVRQALQHSQQTCPDQKAAIPLPSPGIGIIKITAILPQRPPRPSGTPPEEGNTPPFGHPYQNSPPPEGWQAQPDGVVLFYPTPSRLPAPEGSCFLRSKNRLHPSWRYPFFRLAGTTSFRRLGGGMSA